MITMWDEETNFAMNHISKTVIICIITAAFILALLVTNAVASSEDEFILTPIIRNFSYDGADTDRISGFYAIPRIKLFWGSESGKYYTIQAYAIEHKCTIQRIDIQYFRNNIIFYCKHIKE